ncbi:uncharacterized protein nesd [Penaeus vannamei]|uniref:uncharacterized protein nesd n=1 Tax=Penaeus vannamei TaxID=6689 RepID=UPI00387F5408
MEDTNPEQVCVLTKTEGSAEVTDREETETPEVFTATWMPDDHIRIDMYFTRSHTMARAHFKAKCWWEMLRFQCYVTIPLLYLGPSRAPNDEKGAPADRVERVLVHYVEGSIEPAGWQAIWSVSARQSNSFLNLYHCADILVDVVNVSHEKLLAEVTILDPVKIPGNEHDEQLIKQAKGNVMSIPLMQLYPIADQENGLIDINTTTEVVEQVRFIDYNTTVMFKVFQDPEDEAKGSEMNESLEFIVLSTILIYMRPDDGIISYDELRCYIYSSICLRTRWIM